MFFKNTKFYLPNFFIIKFYGVLKLIYLFIKWIEDRIKTKNQKMGYE